MCGIAALFNYNSREPVDREALDSINSCMVNRGPDGEGLWISNNSKVGLAHRRLSIIDLSEKGAQPMHLSEKGLSIIFNGEIYNYKILRKELEVDNIEFASETDTEVILHLYHKFGENMIHKLRGMFAFAIWDENNKKMFLARDPYGIKPLYYSDNGSSFGIASQVKALLKWKEVDTTPEPAGHIGYFLMGSIPEPWTLFKGIKSLPAGHSMLVNENGDVKKNNYSNITKILVDSENQRNGSVSDFNYYLREALLDTIQHHIIADVDVGVFLSAGLDSTTITALTSEFESSIRSVTLGFDEYKGSNNDETFLAEKVANRYNTSHTTKWVGKNQFTDEKENLFESMDQPSIDGVNTYFVSKITKEAGLKVALSGIGGDELFGGYGSFNQIPKLVDGVNKVPFYKFFGTGLRKLSSPFIKKYASPKYAGLFEYGGSYEGAYLLRRGLYMPWELLDLFDPEMVETGLEELQLLNEFQNTIQGVNAKQSKITALESSWYMKNQLLRDADWAGMAHSLEIRVPFVDWHLFKSLASFIGHQNFNKNSMAQTPRQSLPSSILNRKKTGFQVPVQEWIMREEGSNGDKNKGSFRAWAKFVYQNYYKSCGMETELLNRINI